MKNTIVVVGSSNADMVVKTSRLPRPGETVLGGEFFQAPGGKGANQAVSAARAGGKVVFIARVGRDALGDRLIEGYEKDGINVGLVTRSGDKPSGVALIMVGGNGENSIAVAAGANSELAPEHIEKAGDVFSSALVLLVQLEIPLDTVETAVRMAAENGAMVILNPAPARELGEEILSKVDVITPNRSETKALTGIDIDSGRDLPRAADVLIGKGVKRVVITLGAEGAYLKEADYEGPLPGYEVEAVDATAAGDVFNGALAAALTKGKPFKMAVEFANAAAAISVQKLGAQTSIPYKRAIDDFIKTRGKPRISL